MRQAGVKKAGTTLLLGLALSAPAVAQTQQELNQAASTPERVLMQGMNYGAQRFSPLASINKKTVHNLSATWNYSLNNSMGQEAQPIIADGVMYVTTHNATIAINALTGRQIWKNEIDYAADVAKMACCGLVNRGAAMLDGVIFRTTLDAQVIALDAKTGQERWKATAADYKLGYSMTVAPLIANGVLITGISGGEYGTRGFLDGWDPATGQKLWRRYTTALKGEPGGDTWPDDKAEKGGAPTWLTGSYDPELDLLYWGTGNGGPWNAEARKGDNLYIASVLAMRPKTGEIVWFYQFTPNDLYDYDGVNELVHATLSIDGKPRKVIMQANRNGFFYVIDRINGKLLAANAFVKQNWADKIDMTSGRPVESAVTMRIRAGAGEEVFPSAFGGKNWMPMSFNPATGLVYANTLNVSFPYKLAKPDYKQGEWYLGAELTGFNLPKDEPRGYLKAIDPLTGKSKWEMPWKELPSFSGTLSTAGGLVFSGGMNGEFLALDADNGKKLWQFQTGSGIIGQPVTWSHQGKQYVTILSGMGSLWNVTGDEHLRNVPAGGSVWTFALHR